MTKEHSKYVRKLVILSGVLSFINIGLDLAGVTMDVVQAGWMSILFFLTLTTAFSFWSFSSGNSGKFASFMGMLVGGMFSKLVLSSVLMVVYMKWRNPDGFLFIAPFFISYIAFTIIETSHLVKYTKSNGSENQEEGRK